MVAAVMTALVALATARKVATRMRARLPRAAEATVVLAGAVVAAAVLVATVVLVAAASAERWAP